MPNKETFTTRVGSFVVGTTLYANVRNMKASWPDLMKLEEVRTWGDNSYAKVTRPESVCDATVDFVAEDDRILYAFASPTPNNPLGPVLKCDWQWKHPKTASYFRIRYASVYPNNVDWSQDMDGHFGGTISFQCAKEDVAIWCSGSTPPA